MFSADFAERAVYYAAALFLLVTIALVFFSAVVSGSRRPGRRDGARDHAFRRFLVHPPRRTP